MLNVCQKCDYALCRYADSCGANLIWHFDNKYKNFTYNINKCNITCTFFTVLSSHLLVKSIVVNVIISNVNIKCYKYCHYK
jgi:hypothetical protein